MVLIHIFVLAGFVESIAGSTVAAQGRPFQHELCLIGDAQEGVPAEHGHSRDCCLYGCRSASPGPAPAQPRPAGRDETSGAASGTGWANRGEDPPTRMAAPAPFGARGPPLS